MLAAALAPLLAWRQFIVVRFVPSSKPGKTEKLPVDWRTGGITVKGSGGAHDPAVWLSYDEAAATAAALGANHGVGFVFTDADPFWFLDVDNALQPDGQWSALAQHLCTALAGCAVELSHSGRGLHVFGTGALPAHGSRNRDAGLELYHTGRFVALGTGAQGNAAHDPGAALPWLVRHFFPERAEATQGDDWRDAPVPEWAGPTDDDELIARMLASRPSAAAAFAGKASVRDLWEGNAEALARSFPDAGGGRPYDGSSADAALASHLAYFTGNHHERIERLMRRSALVRDKWERDDYLTRTISYCCARTTRWLADRPPTLGPAGAGALDSTGLSFAAAAAGAIPATLLNVISALQSAESGVSLAYDAFRDRVVLRAGSDWYALGDVDYIKLRLALESRGFKSIGADMMRDAVMKVAHDNQFDSAQLWAECLRHDGQHRVETFLHVYFGAADTPYTRACSRYLWTALAGRVMDPGCQADMALIFVDRQGSGKTNGVRALAPLPDTFTEFDLAKIDHPDTSRQFRGTLVAELSELKGLASRDDESIKSWVSRRYEKWIPKFQEFAATLPRRAILLGTSNRRDLLSDPTGNRRWLPMVAGRVEVERITADCAQLWAEGVAMWRRNGVMWEDAQRLAEAEHDAFKQYDPWSERIAPWLEATPAQLPGDTTPLPPRKLLPVSLLDVLTQAVGMPAERVDRRAELRAARVMRELGYVDVQKRIDGTNRRRWVRE